MTSRQTGKRMRSMASRRRSAGARRRRSEPLSRRDLRRLAQLVACGGVFVLLVAAKLLLPARMAAFNQMLSSAMEQNMDVQAVFSAVGRAFSGERSMEELYQAVFHPQEEEAVPTGALQEAGTGTARPVRLLDTGGLDTLRRYRREEADPPAESAAYVLYSQENLPKGVSMEQVRLGFDYGPPLAGGVVSSDFGYRDHPVEGEERFHYGVDLAAEAGAEVDCFADGTVTAVGESSSYGRYCVVAHEGGYATLYAHCRRVTASSGAAVRQGEKIAGVGDTGMATGPHLHFELQRDGAYLNPIYYVSPL